MWCVQCSVERKDHHADPWNRSLLWFYESFYQKKKKSSCLPSIFTINGFKNLLPNIKRILDGCIDDVDDSYMSWIHGKDICSGYVKFYGQKEVTAIPNFTSLP